MPTMMLWRALVLCALMGWAHTARANEAVDAAPAPAPAPALATEDIQRNLQQLSRRIGQLKKSSAQSDRASPGQVEALKQQIASIERSQQELDAQLQALQDDSLQQLQAVQVTKRRLLTALWLLAGTLVMLGLLAWRWRPGARAAQQADTVNAPSTPGEFPDAEPNPQSTALLHAEPAPTPADPLSALVAAERLSTEQAVAQARLSFTQPVQISS